MTEVRIGNVADEGGGKSWASEALPLVERRELLDRELKKLAQRPGAASQPSAHVASSEHPTADAPPHEDHPG